MEAITLLKFWKSTTSIINSRKTITAGADPDDSATVYSDPFTEDSDGDGDDDDDSLFELELTSPHKNFYFDSPNPNGKIEPKLTPKPQSPVSILRSAPPKLRLFTFGKSLKSSKLNESETDGVFSTMSPKRTDSSLFMVKFKIEDGSIVPKFTRCNSSSLSSPRKSNEGHETSKRFSKEAVSKYISKIKPLYTKSTKKTVESERFNGSPARSTVSVSSPRKDNDEKEKQSNSLFNVKRKYLGKSKSASSAITVVSSPVVSPARSDYPSDGIESAILHCKLSLSSPKSKGKSALSRCSSDPSHDNTIQMSE